MIFVTTSSGVFRLGTEDTAPQMVLPRRKGFWPLRRGSYGFFGIAPHPDGDSFLTASRERLGTPHRGRPSTDVRLYRIWKDLSIKPQALVDLKDIHDVHQIATVGHLLLLTDTGLNRIRAYHLQTTHEWSLDVGPVRSDVNHINALCVMEKTLLVGLNNHGKKPAEILMLDLADLTSSRSGADALRLGQVEVLGDHLHTHDLEPFGNDLLYCVSFNGEVYRRSTRELMLHCNDWVRGLAINSEGLWVGNSALAKRSYRHSEKLDGHVSLYDPDTLVLKKRWKLVGAGQVNDIVAW